MNNKINCLGKKYIHNASENSAYKNRIIQIIDENIIKVALKSDALSRRILSKKIFPSDGQSVGVRLNINVLKNTGIAIQSIHRSTDKKGVSYTKGRGYYRGEVISYLPVVTLRDAYFNVDQIGCSQIASGSKSKFPMASIDGIFVDKKEHCFNGIEIKFNPQHSHLFTDLNDFAIQYAQEVTIINHRAYARGLIRYYNKDTIPFKVGEFKSSAKVWELQ